MITINGDRLIADLRKLSEFGRVETGVHRLSLTDEDVAARQWLVGRMREAGLEAFIDGLGNVYGTTPGAKRTVLIGSHTDTVPKGGWLDGAMGVMYGLEVARAFLESHEAGSDVGVDVISFVDEEGHFHGTTGSLAFIGDFDLETVRGFTNTDGVTYADALNRVGFGGAPLARLDRERHAAFMEAHIEQGPVLETDGKRIGIVTGIAGMRRTTVTFGGQADHAGTIPMAMRRDAAGAMIAFLHDLKGRFEAMAAKNTVWNFGYYRVEPGAPNQVAAKAEVTVEFRDLDKALLDRMADTVDAAAQEAAAAARNDVSVETDRILAIHPADMVAEIGRDIEAASRDLDVEPLWMQSGAAHDAMHLARHVPSAMLFVPSLGGRSHDPAEDTSEADIVLGAQVLAGAVDRLLARQAEAI